MCSIAFMISGIMMAITAQEPSPPGNYKAATAAIPSQPLYTPFVVHQTDTGTLDLPEDLIRDFARKKGIQDTVYITKTDTVPVTKVKVKKVPVPSNVMEINVTTRRDTIQVPVYYLATQVGTKEGPTGECISVYEIHKVDEICPENINSSVQPINELDNNVGE